MNDNPYFTAMLIGSALKIADTAVICDVEAEGVRIGAPGERRWDISAMFNENEHSPEFVSMAEQGIAYGVMRGLLEIDTTRRFTVRILRQLGS